MSILEIDFLNSELTYKRLQGGGLGLPIAKACGLKKILKSKAPFKIIDATAGLGEDGFLLASLGAEVFMIERNPEVFQALSLGLSQGLKQAEAAQDLELIKIFSRIFLTFGSALELIPEIKLKQGVIDLIYLDPMFPHRKKSALVKKPMRDLRTLVGDDLDADDLLAIARAHAKKVVVKRPRNAPFLANKMTKDQRIGESSRFDIYPGLND